MGTQWWIGDLCYVMHDCWEEVCNLCYPTSFIRNEGRLQLKDGREFFIFGTAHGDGVYLDQHCNEYGVDSGTLGAIRESEILDPFPIMQGGHVHELTSELNDQVCFSESGTITFGPVSIETDWSMFG